MKHVVVVGAGVVGLFCATRLARAGARVTLLEAEPDDLSVFRPTASAAAGMLAPYDSRYDAREGLALASFNLWREAAPSAPWADGVRFEGGLVVSASEEDSAALQARIMQAGRSVSPLSPGQARSRTGLKAAFTHTLAVADEGVVDPLRVLSGLILEAKQHGVVTRFNADVASVRANAVTTHDDETYEADVVVLAPGAWATDALQAAAPDLRRVQPVKGHLVSVALPKSLKPNVHTESLYLAQRREDVVLGATMEPGVLNRAVNKERVAELLAAAEAFAPGQVQSTGRAWAGIRPMSPDGWPLVGRSGDVLIAAGHSRNGWLLAPITAEIITAYVFGGEIRAEWAALSPQRFS